MVAASWCCEGNEELMVLKERYTVATLPGVFFFIIGDRLCLLELGLSVIFSQMACALSG